MLYYKKVVGKKERKGIRKSCTRFFFFPKPILSLKFSFPILRRSSGNVIPKQYAIPQISKLVSLTSTSKMTSSSSNSTATKRRDCLYKCSERPVTATSWTDDNPGRRFLGCPNYHVRFIEPIQHMFLLLLFWLFNSYDVLYIVICGIATNFLFPIGMKAVKWTFTENYLQ